MQRFILRVIILISLCIPCMTFADNGSAIGDLASNLMEPVSIVSDALCDAAIIIGATFLFATVIKYFQYRVNPLAVPISNVILLFVLGIMLILLPVSYKLLYSTPPTDVTTSSPKK